MTGPRDPHRAVIALGSNLGDRQGTIRAAVRAIDALDGVRVVAASALVESFALKPQGVDESAPSYLNAIVLADVTVTPIDLLNRVNEIEHTHGRVRETVWGDRTLDIDLITVGGVVCESDRLVLPHPRAWQRAFVLAPWLQVEPDAVIPGKGRVADLLAAADDTVREFAGEPLHPVDDGARA